jgi:aminopeptidase
VDGFETPWPRLSATRLEVENSGEGQNLVDGETLSAYARMVLEIGANFQPGQDLAINAQIEHAPLARALANEAYGMDAHYVDIWYWDPHGKRARVERAEESTLAWTPPWLDARSDYLAANHAATVSIAGDPEPDLLSGLDERRAGLDRMPVLESRLRAQMRGDVNWTIVPFPTTGWARTVFGEPDVDRLWSHLKTFLRLNEPDPTAAWKQHIETLTARAAQLNERDFDVLRYEGPGTELTVWLIPHAVWAAAELTTSWGLTHRPNLPTEEVFTTPDFRRTEGRVRSTRPLSLTGTVVRDLELEFREGRVVDVKASTGAETVRAQQSVDDGAARLGEVALVDGSSPIGQSGVTFHDTLLDENATCHIAWGFGIPTAVEGGAKMSDEEAMSIGMNRSKVHIDFMVGGPEVSVTGITTDGERVPILRDDAWQLT